MDIEIFHLNMSSLENSRNGRKNSTAQCLRAKTYHKVCIKFDTLQVFAGGNEVLGIIGQISIKMITDMQLDQQLLDCTD